MNNHIEIPLSNEFSFLKLAHILFSYHFPNDNLKKAFFLFLYHNIKRMGVTFFLHMEFANILFNNNIPDYSDNDINDLIKLLRKKYRVSKSFFSPRISFKYFFALVLAYALKLESIDVNSPQFAHLCDVLKIKKDYQQLLEGYINLPGTGNTEELLSFFQNTPFKKIDRIIHPLSIFINQENTFYNLPRKKITVFSTMSAGKSTFINALLGHDYLPSKNEACTAKITTIADTDHINYCLGYAVKKEKQVFCGNVDKKKIDEWNNDGEISEIILEGNLDRIGSEKIIAVIHDTPGINYSGNSLHKEITLTHLIDSRPDVIICLLDATQMLTTDFSEALEDLKKSNDEGSKAKVIFVINKADSYDPQKESLKDMIGDTHEELKKYGFDAPIIIPVSSQAARLFKMALQGRGSFTENEIDSFTGFIRFFLQPENNFGILAAEIPDNVRQNTEYETNSEHEIIIEGKVYERDNIVKALFNTGIPVVENIINCWKEAR
jgi:GTPase Era involved in 16S rRNA processing